MTLQQTVTVTTTEQEFIERIQSGLTNLVLKNLSIVAVRRKMNMICKFQQQLSVCNFS